MKHLLTAAAFLCFFCSLSHAAPSNIIVNGSFAKDITGWSSYGGHISWDAQVGHSGRGCVLITQRSQMGHGLTQQITGKLMPNSVYKYTAWIKPKTNTASHVSFNIYSRDGKGQSWMDSGNQMILPGKWNKIVAYLKAPEPQAVLSDQVLTIGNAAVGYDYYIDDVSIVLANDEQANITIDCSKVIGKSTGRGIGFLFGVTANEPDSSMFEAIKPKMVRHRAVTTGKCGWGSDTGFVSEAFMTRLQKAAVHSVVIVSDEYCFEYGYSYSWGWPGDASHDGIGSYELLDRTIEAIYNQSVSKGYHIEWDIWNEPDFEPYWKRDTDQYLALWKHAYNKIRSLDSNAVIVGPSNALFAKDGVQAGFIKRFLLFCKANQCLPNVLSWHEMDGYRDLPKQIDIVNNFMHKNGIARIPIDINEYVGEDATRRPGAYPWYWKTMEEKDIRYGAHACWKDGDGKEVMLNGRLDGLVTDKPYQPLAAWYVTKAYSDMVGELLPVSSTDAVTGFACRSNGDMVKLLIGNSSGSTQHTKLKFQGLRQKGSSVLVIQHIPDTGWVSTPLPSREQKDITVNNGKLTVELNLNPYEAVYLRVVTLTK